MDFGTQYPPCGAFVTPTEAGEDKGYWCGRLPDHEGECHPMQEVYPDIHHRCALCGMRAFYYLDTITQVDEDHISVTSTPLCKAHGDDHKRGQVKAKVPDNIRTAWSYWDGRKRSFHYNLEDVPEPWRDEAERVRLRVKLEWEGEILKAEVLR
jgi:hypothetical protein